MMLQWKRPYHAQQSTQALLAAIVEGSNDAIISRALNGTITSWNKAAQKLFGYSAMEAIGQPFNFLIPPDGEIAALKLLDDIRNGRSVESSSTVRISKAGKRVSIVMHVSPILDMAGRVIGSSHIVSDNGDKLEAERTNALEEMTKAQEQLRQSQKMESIGQLTGGIAHDFNNLLAVILGNLDFMHERTTEKDPLREFIRPSIEAAEHGAELTQQLLSFGRKQALQPKIVNANELLHYFTTLVRHTLGERIQTIMSLSADLWNVNIDASQLQNALLNLAVNARDAMPDGGKLIFETKNITLDADYSDANFEVAAGDYVLIAVSDSGEGMTQDVLEKVFEPFFTTKDVGKGSGLGLSMVYGFVKQSAGHIKIYSEYGQGTSVKIYLPRALGESELLVNTPSRDVIQCVDKAKLVLVVEDNKEVLKLTSSMVESLGYDVLTALNGDSALNVLKQHHDIDVLLTDVMLPGSLNGPVLAKHAQALNPKLKVLFNSGYAEHAIQQRGILEAGVNLIGKPFRKQQLAEKLAEVLKQAQGEPA